MANLPDFMTDPNAVLKDTDCSWRYNRIPDYNKVNATYLEGKKINMYTPSCTHLFQRKNQGS